MRIKKILGYSKNAKELDSALAFLLCVTLFNALTNGKEIVEAGSGRG